MRRLAIPGTDKNVWLAAAMPPMRGWLVQRLAIALVATEDLLVHADSDIGLYSTVQRGLVAGMPPADYREVFEARWAALGADASTTPRSDS